MLEAGKSGGQFNSDGIGVKARVNFVNSHVPN